MTRFDDIFERVVGHEGGFSDDPRDKGNWTGGAVGLGELKGTKYGISAASYPKLDIKNLTLEHAKEIYRRDFWDAIQGNLLPQPVDEYVFDYAVNSGVERAAMALQAAVGALQDGNIGPKTIRAVMGRDPLQVIRLLFVDRAIIFELHPKEVVYGRGWYARLFDKTLQAFREVKCASSS